MNSVWKMNRYTFRWYLRHPLNYFNDTFRRIKWAWQRITKGYCDYDLFDVCGWVIGVFPMMLREFVQDLHTYPGEFNGFTPESWDQYIKDMADAFEGIEERGFDGYERTLDDLKVEFERQNDCKNKAFDMMRDVFFSIWD